MQKKKKKNPRLCSPVWTEETHLFLQQSQIRKDRQYNKFRLEERITEPTFD